MKTLIVDNYDSFTYNLYQLVGQINGAPPIVIYNDKLTWDQFVALAPDNVILSPGPGRPENERDFGICRRILLESRVPVLGVCLGLQGMAHVFGGKVVPAPEPMHGRSSAIHHDGTRLFEGIPETFHAVRYHSLMVEQPIPDVLRVTAWTEDNLVMGLAHRERPLWAVQFHPESISTEHGEQLLRNFLGTTPRVEENRPATVPDIRTSWQVFSRRLDVHPSPEDTFCALFGDTVPSFWLDASDDRSRSRFSFMGSGTLIPKAPVFEYLTNELRDRYCSAPELPFDFVGGFVGYLEYELNSGFVFVDRFLAFDHQEKCLYLVHAAPLADSATANHWLDEMENTINRGIAKAPLPKPAAEPPHFEFERNKSDYLEDIRECLRLINEGESYEICLTNRLKGTNTVDPLDYYRVLRRLNPAPYSAFLRFPDVSVACSSPERFLRIDRIRNVESRPIKGTARRSRDPVEDARLRESLRTGTKTRAENLMIVDLLRNDLGRVCEIGSVHVPQMMEVETYANLHQLVSTVRGRLRNDATVVECIRNAFPGGSMTGAPKIRTMEIIDRLEQSPRGVYSGTIGFLSLNGTADLNIVIRTAVFIGSQVTIGVGGAIVALSDPEEEFEEAVLKGQRLLDAFSSSPATSGLPEKSSPESTQAPTPPGRRLP
jgi:para-aminobenzoate synthetase